MKVLAALSGGVDSSVAAARLLEAGHEVVAVTMRLWGGESDSGCCSVADVDDARRVAQQLDVAHLVFNFGDDFAERVVAPYVEDHRAGRTPNPCIECNRHLKFDRLLRRAEALGFDAVATGHHARVGVAADGRPRVRRGADPAKDQSYVLYVLSAAQLAGVRFPVGELTKDEVRAEAARLGLRTAAKPDSQDVCFVTARSPGGGGGRRAFLGDRIPLTPGRLVDRAGAEVGTVDAVELVTVGQRRGLALAGADGPRYALAVDPGTATVTVGVAHELLDDGVTLIGTTWAGGSPPPPGTDVVAQCSAHGRPRPATVGGAGSTAGGDGLVLRWHEPQRRVAPGQSVVLYDGDLVLGGGAVGGGALTG